MNVRLRPTLTPELFEAMSGTDGFELVDGELKEKGIGNESATVESRINRRLSDVVEPGGLGWVAGSEAGFICFPHRPNLVRKPDVSFVARGRYPDDRPPRGYARIAPDLAVEVVSPNDTYEEIEEKVDDYLRAGVPLIWVASPAGWTVHMYAVDGTVRRLTADDELTADPVLAGFRVRVGDLFPPPAPQPPAAP